MQDDSFDYVALVTCGFHMMQHMIGT